jgi:hypothetical protein
MATLTLRIPKGSPLTNAELDDNFANLDNDKVEIGGDLGGSTSNPLVISFYSRPLSSSAPTTGQAIVWNGSAWIPQTVSVGGGGSGTSTVTSTVTLAISSTTTTYPAFSVYPSSSVQQTITSGSQQKVLFQNEEFDTGSCFADSKFTPTVAGYYQLNAVVRLNGTMGTGENMLVIWKNGAEYKRGWNQSGTEIGANFVALQVSALVYADGVDDYFEVYIQQGSGSNRDITTAHSAGYGNISWFNGTYVPTELITAVTSQAATVTSTVTGVGGGTGTVNITVLNDISKFFDRKSKSFTLKNGNTAITEGLDYGDSRDLLVVIGGRVYSPAIEQNNLGPWIVDMEAENTYTYKVAGSRITFYREPEYRQTASIRINNVSASRQQRTRYPFTPNTIAFGD